MLKREVLLNDNYHHKITLKAKYLNFNYCDKFNKSNLLIVHIKVFEKYFHYFTIICNNFFDKVGR